MKSGRNSTTEKSGVTLQRHLTALLKFAPVELRFCSCKRRGKGTLDTPINPCARSACSRSVAVGLLSLMQQFSVVLENSNVAKLASTQYLSVHSLPQEDRYDTDDASTREIYPMLVP